MIPRGQKFWCDICDKDFKQNTVFDQDLHIRRYHEGKIIDDAVKKYTRVILAGME